MIGLLQQFIRIFAVLGSDRNADARPDIDGPTSDVVGDRQGLGARVAADPTPLEQFIAGGVTGTACAQKLRGFVGNEM
jgi:hypothetical protein